MRCAKFSISILYILVNNLKVGLMHKSRVQREIELHKK